MKRLMGWGFLAVTIAIVTSCGSKDGRLQQPDTVVTTNYTTLNITNLVVFTNTIIVTNTVFKEVPVWSMPDEYVRGHNLLEQMTNATYVSPSESLFNIQDVQVEYEFSTTAKDVLDTDSIKAKFELTLRNNNVPMNPQSKDILQLDIDAFYDDSNQNVLCYSIQYCITTIQWITRNQEWHLASVSPWTKGSYGTVGRLKASDAIEQIVTKDAEVFANDYLKDNPKK